MTMRRPGADAPAMNDQSELLSCFRTATGRSAFLSAYDGVLSLWTTELEEIDIATKGSVTHAIVSGPPHAPPLLLLHGAGMASTMWFAVAGALSERHRVYAVDTPGDAGKSLTRVPLVTRAASAAWLEDVLDALGLQRAAVVGHSYGGWQALNFVLYAPKRVSRLGLLAPAASLRPFSLRFYLTFLLMAPLAFSAPTLRLLIGEFSAVRSRIPEELHRQIWETRHARPRLSTPTVYSPEELRRLAVPTLLLVGARDIIYSPRKVLDRAKRQIADFEGELIPGAGHLLTLDRPDLVSQRLLRFLER